MEITKSDIRRFVENSLSTALKLGYDSSILLQMERKQKKVLVGLAPDIEGEAGMWFGYCAYNVPGCLLLIGVSPTNLSTKPEEVISAELQRLGMPEKLVVKILEVYRQIPRELFFEIYNQSGMDHELIGHGYHYLKGEEHGEDVAVKEQLKFANERAKSDSNWSIIMKIMPIILGYLKKIDELK